MERDEDTPLVAGVDPPSWYLCEYRDCEFVRYWDGVEVIFMPGEECRMRKWKNFRRLLTQEEAAKILEENERLKKDLRAAMDALWIASEVKGLVTGKFKIETARAGTKPSSPSPHAP
jgi:hypothetical protein